MVEGSDGTGVFCEQCQTIQPVTETVPWQPDLCAVCGADVSADEDPELEADVDG